MNDIKYNTTEKTWHDIANRRNVWVKWRFEVLKISMEKIGIDFKNNYKCLDVGCGNNDFALSFLELTFCLDFGESFIDDYFLSNLIFFSSPLNKRSIFF